jgi:hypothetical protein
MTYASALSSLTTSTIAAACARGTVSAVIAIRAYLGGEDPGRKSSRQLQRGFKAATCSLSHEPDFRRRGLRVGPLNHSAEDTRRLRCTRGRRWRSKRHGRTCPYFVLPPAVFPHPCRSLCWIAIRHTFYSDACTVYRVPVDGYDIRIRLSLAKPAPPGVRFLSKS